MPSDREHDLRPLTRNYTREKAVVEDIRALRAAPRAEFWRRIRISDFQDPESARLESLVYWIREFKRTGDDDSAWSVAEAAIQRIKRTVVRRLAGWKQLTVDQRDEVEEALALGLYTEWMSLDGADEFWEVRFGVCLERAISDEIDKQVRVLRHEKQLTPLRDAEGEESDAWENVADEPALDAATSAEVKQALEQLEEPLRSTFRMYYYLGLSEDQIAHYWDCTTRTIRNYLRRAREKLAAWREE